jgi:hypothetical protein
MSKFIIASIFSIFLLSACSDKKIATRLSINFTRFQLGYSNGWTKSVAFRVDSNRIFFALKRNDKSIKYGLVPDSILQLIEATLSKTISRKIVSSTNNICEDCSTIILEAIEGRDSILIQQNGNIDRIFWPIITALQPFIASELHSTFDPNLLQQLQAMFSPPPPPSPKNRLFMPPKEATKSGR